MTVKKARVNNVNKIRKWVSEHKNEPAFKYTVIIVVLIFLAIAVQIYDNIRTEWENAEAAETAALEEIPEEETENAAAEFLDNSRAHIIMLVSLSAAIAYIEHRKTLKLKESR